MWSQYILCMYLNITLNLQYARLCVKRNKLEVSKLYNHFALNYLTPCDCDKLSAKGCWDGSVGQGLLPCLRTWDWYPKCIGCKKKLFSDFHTCTHTYNNKKLLQFIAPRRFSQSIMTCWQQYGEATENRLNRKWSLCINLKTCPINSPPSKASL